MPLNTYYVVGVSRRQDQKLTQIVKNGKIIELHYYIWNHHEKFIQTSTNMPGIYDLVIREIVFEITRILR